MRDARFGLFTNLGGLALPFFLTDNRSISLTTFLIAYIA